MMTPREFRDEAAAWAKTVHPNAQVRVMMHNHLEYHDGKPFCAWLTGYPGSTLGSDPTVYVEQFDEVVPALSAMWEAMKEKIKVERLRALHAELTALEAAQ